MGTIRKYLSGEKRARGHASLIDMEAVYKKINAGHSVAQVAAELGVHRSTLYRKHKKYQEQLKTLEKNNIHLEDELLPLD